MDKADEKIRADPQGEALLRLAAGEDKALLEKLRERFQRGEPAAYLAGFLVFRGRRFAMDARAYVTDPELMLLVEAVLEEGDRLEKKLARPPHILEFGVGAGTLLLTLAHERPHWQLSGIDIDADALRLAGENARQHQKSVRLWQSNYLEGWPTDMPPPDILYGDPPWGNGEDLYDPERNETYYTYMPRHSVFPPESSRTGIHDELIRQVVVRRWPTLLLLNCGILPPEEIRRSAAPLPRFRIREPRPGLRLLHGYGTPEEKPVSETQNLP